MRLRLDRERCTGHGRCYAIAPELFEPDDDGYAIVRDVDVDATNADTARRAAANCPERAISVES